MPVIKDIIRAYGIPLLEVAGFEADDIIGTMAKRAEAAGWDVYMLTPDKDYAQLVTPHIHMCRPAKGAQPMEVLGPEEVCAKYGISDTAQFIKQSMGLDGVQVAKVGDKLVLQGVVENQYEMNNAMGIAKVYSSEDNIVNLIQMKNPTMVNLTAP